MEASVRTKEEDGEAAGNDIVRAALSRRIDPADHGNVRSRHMVTGAPCRGFENGDENEKEEIGLPGLSGPRTCVTRR